MAPKALMATYRLLHVEDSPDDAELLRHALDGAPFAFTLTRVETEAQYLASLDAGPPDAIICDYDLPEFSAERALEILRGRGLDVPFIIASHHVGESAAVVAMQNGAADYLPKRDLRRLPKAIESALDRSHSRREKERAQEALRQSEATRRGILDSLVSRIALVDGGGFIIAVNKAWEDFEVTRASAGRALEGADYLRSLEKDAERGDVFAGTLRDGVRSVIAREKKLFSMECSARTDAGIRWYIARAVPLEGSDRSTVISQRDITEKMMTNLALEDANKRLQAVSKRMLAIQEEERRAISRELHDDIGQTLGALKIGLHRLARAGPPGQEELISECLRAAEQGLGRLRELAMDLRPPQLDQLGLEEALGWLAERQSGATGIAVTCKVAGLDERPPAPLEIACYRIAQEALNNATRHAAAKQVLVSVESDGALLKLVVRDDGVGFDEDSARLRAARSGSMGLIGMEERAQLAGGRLKVRSAPGGGTTVSVVFPLQQRASGKSARSAVAR